MESQTKKFDMTRRDFMRIASTYGMTSTFIALGGLAGVISAPRLAAAANSIYERRYKTTPKYEFKFGGCGENAFTCLTNRCGYLNFIQDFEERTDGAVRIEFYGNNSICGEATAYTKARQGVFEFFGNSSQNSTQMAPYYSVLDFPTLWNRASLYYFLYHPKSEKLLREPLRRINGVEVLSMSVEMRNYFLGAKYGGNTPVVNTLDQIKGAKIRTAGSQLGIIGIGLTGVNPTPIAWEETFDALRQGLCDGQETVSNALTMANMVQITTQMVPVELFPATKQVAVTVKTIDKLDAATRDALYESAYFTQAYVQGTNEATILASTGAVNPPPEGSEFAKYGVRVATFSPEEKEKLRHMASPDFNPDPYASWRERLNKMCNGTDVYEELKAIAKELPENTRADAVEPRRWWRG